MPKAIAPFSIEETDVIRRLHAKGCGDRDIAEALDCLPCNDGRRRSVSSVYCWRMANGLLASAERRRELIREAQKLSPTGINSSNLRRETVVRGDIAFKRAMLAAINQGLESPVVGIIKDRRPIKAMAFQCASFCFGASSAASCADQGDSDSGSRRYA